jgi:hypothetical protein
MLHLSIVTRLQERQFHLSFKSYFYSNCFAPIVVSCHIEIENLTHACAHEKTQRTYVRNVRKENAVHYFLRKKCTPCKKTFFFDFVLWLPLSRALIEHQGDLIGRIFA